MSSFTSISPGKITRLIGTSLLFATVFVANLATADERSEQQPKTIVFVCLHGSVKSQMAAAHFTSLPRSAGCLSWQSREALPSTAPFR
jgi:hypothetical protein